MATVRQASSAPNQVSVKSAKQSLVSSTIQPSAIRDMGDVQFPELDASQDGKYIMFDAAKKKFVLQSADELLSTAVSDNDLPDDFISQIESEIDLGQIAEDIDGGGF